MPVMTVEETLLKIPSVRDTLSDGRVRKFATVIGTMVKNPKMGLAEGHQSVLHAMMHEYIKGGPWSANTADLTQACIIATWLNSLWDATPQIQE